MNNSVEPRIRRRTASFSLKCGLSILSLTVIGWEGRDVATLMCVSMLQLCFLPYLTPLSALCKRISWLIGHENERWQGCNGRRPSGLVGVHLPPTAR